MTSRKINVPNFDIYVNGSKLSNDVKKYISQVSVQDMLDAPSSFNFQFQIVDLQKGKWQGIDLDMFSIGDSVDVYIGMDQPTLLVSGAIDSLNVNFGDESTLDVSGFSWLHKLTFGTNTYEFKNMSDSDIASTIARKENLTADVDSTDTVYEQVNQNNQSNFQFLLSRSKRIGYQLSATKKSLLFKQSAENQASATTLAFGVSLDQFSVSLNNLDEGSSVEVRGWDMLKKEPIVGNASQGDEDSKMGEDESGFSVASESSAIVVQTADPFDLGNASKLAKDKYNELLLDFMTGNGQCLGNTAIRAGRTIEISGVGETYGGKYYVNKATHTINSQGYQTQFDVRKTAV